MEYLKDSTYFKKVHTDPFGITTKKSKAIELATELVERLFGNEMADSEIEKAQDKNSQKRQHSDDESPDDPESQREEIELSVQQELEKAIRSVSENENITDNSSMTKKAMRKEFEVYEESHQRTKNLERLWHALNSIQPTSVESERAFSAAGLYLTKL